MNEQVSDNNYFKLALDYVNTTGEHIYLTGKAGTGKTTFLQYIRENCHKKLVVAAPTGVAAINAGGVTLHSLFQVPPGGFLPETDPTLNEYSTFFDKNGLLKHLRLNRAKRELLRELELLVIDEVSMLRADMLDAVDAILRSVRRRSGLPFGGVQVLFIGDLFQLPPVVKPSEWHVLSQHYQSPSFFNARVLAEAMPVYLELKTIYRQSDEAFIRLLNNVRNNKMTAADLRLLNRHYEPDFTPEKDGQYITLTTHNRMANRINADRMAKLPGAIHAFSATITGDFNENTVTAETELQVKEGAQVMFVRNDKEVPARYYNGKIGIIERITDNRIVVRLSDTGIEVEVGRETWENKRYKLNKQTGDLEEDIKGTFTQYPLRLAWAITIHKSQGLTFDKAIIDAGESFAPGQVYVALSRLTSLEGLVLYSRISDRNISVDASAVAFSNHEKAENELQNQLTDARVSYIREMLLRAFDWEKLNRAMTDFYEDMNNKRLPDKHQAMQMAGQAKQALLMQQVTAEKFKAQLKSLLPTATQDQYVRVHERVKAAGNYFTEKLSADVTTPLTAHREDIKLKKGIKKYLRELDALIAIAEQKRRLLKETTFITEGLTRNKDVSEIMERVAAGKRSQQRQAQKQAAEAAKKPEKGESQKLSLALYKSGKSIEDIADERGLKAATIENHLMTFIGSDIKLNELVSEDKIEKINKALDAMGEVSLTELKSALPDDISFSNIRAVIKDRQLKTQTEKPEMTAAGASSDSAVRKY